MKHLEINICPICDNRDLSCHLDLKDHYFSQEEFRVIRCDKCGLGITTPQPSAEQINKYYDSENYISHGNSKKVLVDRLYRLAQKINFRSKLSLIRSVSDKLNLLDYGAGSGRFCSYMSSCGFRVSGFEPSVEARKNAKKTLGLELSSKLPTNKFEIITMWHVLEHVHDLNDTLVSLISLLNQGGYLFIALPNYQSLDARYYQDKWAAYDVPRHLWHFNESAIKGLAIKHGLRHVKTTPMKFDALYVSMLSEQYRKGSRAKGFLKGIRSNLSARKKTPYSSQTYIFQL